MVMFMGHEVHTVGIRDGISRVMRWSIWAEGSARGSLKCWLGL